MGVCECDRNGCENVCSRDWFGGIGYVCSNCKGEFISEVLKSGRNKMAEKKFYKYLNKFMKTTEGNFHIKPKKDKEYKYKYKQEVAEYFSN